MSDLVPIPPSYTYISPGLLNNMRREVARFLLHTYTRTSRIVVKNDVFHPDVELDSWGQQTYAFGTKDIPGTKVDGIACFYGVMEAPYPSTQGLTTLNRPVLTLNFDDPLVVGDHVSNIRTADGTLLLEGPVSVESLQPRDPNLGGPLLVQAILRDVQMIPND